MADAPVEIVEYSPQWPQMFALERELLAESLAQWLVGAPEHIGSTAVPGLAAKPVVDIMAPVACLIGSVAVVAAAERVGYMHFPYKPEAMHWFCKPSPEHRKYHLHLVPAGSRLWQERIAFRDALRGSAALRTQYRALKLRLAAENRHDREAYTEAKGFFVSRVIQAVLGQPDGAV